MPDADRCVIARTRWLRGERTRLSRSIPGRVKRERTALRRTGPSSPAAVLDEHTEWVEVSQQVAHRVVIGPIGPLASVAARMKITH